MGVSTLRRCPSFWQLCDIPAAVSLEGWNFGLVPSSPGTLGPLLISGWYWNMLERQCLFINPNSYFEGTVTWDVGNHSKPLGVLL